MRIAFMGKGGSGKTTLAAAFIRHHTRQGIPVLAVDGDLNAHLHTALRLSGAPIALNEHAAAIFAALEGDRTDFQARGIVPDFGALPPSPQSHFITPRQHDPFLARFALREGSVTLLATGAHRAADLTHSCYHMASNPLELVYHRLLDEADDLVVADCTAGVDGVGTSLFMVHDLTIFVVEPTPKSTAVCADYLKLLRGRAIPVGIIVNQVRDPTDLAYVATQLPRSRILGAVAQSRAVRQSEQDDPTAFDAFVAEHTPLWARLTRRLRRHPRDWATYRARLVAIYQRECHAWWNAYYRTPLDDLWDRDYTYERARADHR
ncbi:MAG: hypothetical protein H0X24_04025 [Ktedonobacterales bacterium]|nr:hypothetical protein [Ktedonobacterales bacterium]